MSIKGYKKGPFSISVIRIVRGEGEGEIEKLGRDITGVGWLGTFV